MGKKAWIGFAFICVVIIAAALALMLVLVPQSKSSTVQEGAYEAVVKQDYTYAGASENKLKQEYNVTEDDVNKGKKTKYTEGNINPFTPPKEVTIYNEPTIKNENGSSLTPESK